MKRSIIALFILLAAMLWTVSTGAAPLAIKNSKHDLSSGSTATIRSVVPASGGTSEICVFCHTPHAAKNDAPLWNRLASTATYTLYSSDVLGPAPGINYPAAEDPQSIGATGYAVHVKTRICMSCHDGTVALGSLVNLPSPLTAPIPMLGTGADNKLPAAAAGYVGTDLRDDHPVAIVHNPGGDAPRLTSVSNAKIRLYTAAGNNYVECTSCHDAHDNQYGNFLVDTNQQSGLCLACHQKTGFALSAHATDTTVYAPATGGTPATLGANVGQVKCMNCHFPHKAGITPGTTAEKPNYGRYLLSYKEEETCFNNKTSDRWGTAGVASSCHGTAAVKNIETDLNNTSKHPVKDTLTAPVHQATEAQSAGWFNSVSVRHTECEDCHNPHTSGKTSHTSPVASPGGNPPVLTSSSSIYGVNGVNVTFPAGIFTAPAVGAYTFIKTMGLTDNTSVGVDLEYKICFKCHTLYAWNNGTVPTSSSLGAAMTDQAQEFNINNASNHPVARSLVGHTSGRSSLTGGWTSPDTQTMYCSDCHTRTGGSVKGAHGSSQPFILSGAFDDQYGTVGGTQQTTPGLCSQCHQDSVYSTATRSSVAATNGVTGFREQTTGYNLHTQHMWASANIANKRSYRCVNCHIRIVHGWQRDALVVVRNDGAPYEAGGANTGLITSWTQAVGNYTITSCGSAAANGVTGCHP